MSGDFPSLPGFEILAEQRRDRLGAVYLARQILYRRDVALRVVDERARGGGRDLTPLERTAREAARPTHPHLTVLLDVGESEGQFYLVSNLPPGPSLHQRLAGAALESGEAAGLLAAIARAVHHLHEHGVLHLGLTSHAIFVAPDGSPRIADLGLAGVLHGHPDSTFPLDPSYASPEQLAGGKATARSDVYALGCLLYECLTGKPPFSAATDQENARLAIAGRWLSPRAVNRACPPALERICRKALSLRPERRQLSAADFADELERFQRGETTGPGVLDRLTGWVRLRPATAAFLGALLLGLVCFLVLTTIYADAASSLRAEADGLRQQAVQAAEETRSIRDELARVKANDASRIRTAESDLRRTQQDLDKERQRAKELEQAGQRAEQQAREQTMLRDRAESRARDMEVASKTALAARAEAARQLARLYVGQGTALMDAGDLAGALVPFTRALAVARREKLPDEAHRLRLAVLLSRVPRPLSVLQYKKGDLNRVLLSPDGNRLLTVGSDGVVVVRNAATGRLVGKRLVHGAPVISAVFSPDARRVLTGDGQGTLRLWNVEDASAVFDPVALEAVPQHLSFSGDGKRFAVVLVAEDGSASVQAHDATNGETIGEAFTTQVAACPASLSPDGKRLLLCCTDRAARIWDVASGKQIGPALEHQGDVVLAIFSADGRRVLTAGTDTARVWDALTGRPVHAPLEHDSSVLPGLDESARLVLTVGKEGRVHIWDLTQGKQAGPDLRISTLLRQAVLSPDGRLALLAGGDGVARVFDVATGQLVLPPLVHAQPLVAAAMSPNGTRALTSDGRIVRVWDLTSGEPLAPAGPDTDAAGVFSPDGKRLARIQGDTVQIHDVVKGSPIGMPMKHKGEVQRVVFTSEGDRLLTVSTPPDGATTPTWDVRVWETSTGRPVSDALEHLREVRQATFVAGGSRVLTVAQDTRARLWDVKTSKLVGKALDHPVDVVLAALSPDGKHVVTSDIEGVSRAWDSSTGERQGDGMAHVGVVRFVAFSVDSKMIATCSDDGTARVWELGTSRRLMQADHAGEVTHASFSPDGKLLLTASTDGTARVWSVQTGKAHTPPLLHGEPVYRTAFSTTGRWLLTAAGRLVRLWDAETGEPIGPPLPHSRHAATVTQMELSKTGELVTQASPGTRWSRVLVGESRSDTDLMDLTRVLAGREEVDPGQLIPVVPETLESAWDHLMARYESEFAAPRQRLLVWARRGATECESRGLWAGAIRHLDALLAERSTPTLYARRGKARAQMGQDEAALADFDKALESGTGRWEWWAGRARAAAALRRWDRAAADYTQATKLEDSRGELWYALGQAEAERGRWKESADALSRAVRFESDNPGAWYSYALVQLSAGDVKGYARTCGRLARKFSGQEDALTRRAVADAFMLGAQTGLNLKPLLARAEKAAATSTDGSEQARLAALLLRTGQAERATRLLEKVTADGQGRPGDLWLLVLAYEKAGQKEKAREWLDRAQKAKHRSGASWEERQASALWRREAEAVMKDSGGKRR